MMTTRPPERFARGRRFVRPIVGTGGEDVTIHKSYVSEVDMWLPRDEYLPMLQVCAPVWPVICFFWCTVIHPLCGTQARQGC